jgi:Na+-transporting methylmalonyl-CoA/oxaloacetate decarboxylase gamma subunit
MNVTLAVTAPVATHAIVLAQQPDSGDNGGQGEDFGKSSPVGFLLLLIFLIAVAFLVRSMTKHLKRVPESFDPEKEAPADEASSGEEPGETTESDEKAANVAKAADKEKSESSG